MKEFYSLNMAALKEAAPHLHDKLKTIQSNEQFEVFAGKDPIDINILDHAQNTPLYTEPVADTLAFLKEMGPYSRYPFLVFFGVGNGFFYQIFALHSMICCRAGCKSSTCTHGQFHHIKIAVNSGKRCCRGFGSCTGQR